VPAPLVSKSFAGRSWRLLPFFLILLLGLPTLLYPYGRDQAMFAYVGSVWRQGGLPYRDAWDVKLPGVYAVYALLGGVEWGPRLLDLFAVTVTAWTLIRIGRTRASDDPQMASVGLVAAVLTVVYTLGACDFWNLAQTETLIAPLSALAVAFGLSRRPLAAGLLAGCAAMIKTTAVAAAVPVLLCCWLPEFVSPSTSRVGLTPASRRRLLLTVAGWLVPLLVVLGYFAVRGGLPYLAELVATQCEYAAGDPRLSGRSPFVLIGGLGLAGYLPIVLVSGLGVCFAVARQWRSDHRWQVSPEWVLLAWWGIALAQVVVQRRFYLYHWAVLTPPSAWFAAKWVATGWKGRTRYLQPTIVGFAVVFLVAAVAPRWPSWRWAGAVLAGQMPVAEFRGRHTGVFGYDVRFARQAAEHVRERSQPEDPLLVLAFEPEVYLYSDRRAPTRHASEAPLFGETSIVEGRRRAWFAELRSDLNRRPPLYVVDRDVPHLRPEWSRPLFAWITQDYRQEATYGPFRVYRRRAVPGG
jgi:hypothetical protein